MSAAHRTTALLHQVERVLVVLGFFSVEYAAERLVVGLKNILPERD